MALLRCIGGGFRFPPLPMSEQGRKFLGNEKGHENGNDMTRRLMSITASVVVCGVCLCTHGFHSTTKTVVKNNVTVESRNAVANAVKVTAEQGGAVAQYNLALPDLNPHHPASEEQGDGRRAILLLTRATARGHVGAKAKLKELGVET